MRIFEYNEADQYQASDPNEALEWCDLPRDYRTWKDLVISAKAAGCDFSNVVAWSAQHPDNYDEHQLATLWENVDEDGALSDKLLYKTAWSNGWKPSGGQQGSGPRTVPIEDLTPAQQAARQLETLFAPDDCVRIVAKATRDASGKYGPTYGVVRKCSEWLELLAAVERPEDLFPDRTPEAGVWLAINPLDGAGISDANVTAYRYALVESDSVGIPKQIATIEELGLPVATMTSSAGKSVHAVVRISADNEAQYRDRVDMLHAVCNSLGLDVDRANRNPSRLSRLAGAARGDSRQSLLAINKGATSWAKWSREAILAKLSANPDEEPPAIQNALDFHHPPENIPELAEPLIPGFLRRGGIMLLSAPPKSGKSWLTCALAVSLACGGRWLKWNITRRSNVLIVNTEMDENEFLFRMRKLADYQGAEWAEVCRRVMIVSTCHRPTDTVRELARAILSGATGGFRPDVVIIDPLYPVLIGEESSSNDSRETMNHLRQIGNAFNASIIYCHHHSKGAQGQKEARDRASGSHVLSASYAALLDMTELYSEDLTSGVRGWHFATDVRSFPHSAENAPFNALFSNGIFTVDRENVLEGAASIEAHRAKERREDKANANRASVCKKLARAIEANGGQPVRKSSCGITEKSFEAHVSPNPDYIVFKAKRIEDGQPKGQACAYVAFTKWREEDSPHLQVVD